MHLGLACALGVLGFVAPACGGPSPLPLELASSWPSDPPSLEVATKTWTRSAAKRGGLDTDVELIVDVDATFRAPQWRAAYVEHLRKRGALSEADTQKLADDQKKAATENHEFALLVATHDRRINDLAKNDRSSWKLRLRNQAGAEVAPKRIYKDRRPPGEIAAELPHLENFDEIYIAEFPADFALLGDEAKEFSLTLFSTRASVEITWARATTK